MKYGRLLGSNKEDIEMMVLKELGGEPDEFIHDVLSLEEEANLIGGGSEEYFEEDEGADYEEYYEEYYEEPEED